MAGAFQQRTGEFIPCARVWGEQADRRWAAENLGDPGFRGARPGPHPLVRILPGAPTPTHAQEALMARSIIRAPSQAKKDNERPVRRRQPRAGEARLMTLGAATTGPGWHRAVFRWWRSAGARYLAGGGPGRGFRAWTKYGSQRMPARSLDETEIFLEARLRVAAGRSGAGVACGSAECLARGGRVGRTQALQSTGFAAGPSAIRKRPAQLGKEVEAFERQAATPAPTSLRFCAVPGSGKLQPQRLPRDHQQPAAGL